MVKRLYLYNDCDNKKDFNISLMLTDEQAAVFYWFKNRGYDFTFTRLDNLPPEEIVPEKWIEENDL